MKKIFGIFSFSIFLGILTGLSSSPVVSILITALTGFIGILIGLKTNASIKEKSEGSIIDYSVLSIFGLSAILGVFGGLYLKSEAPWLKNISELKTEWESIGVEEGDALNLVIFLKTGLVPPSMSVSDNQNKHANLSSSLFAQKVTSFDKLNPENFQSHVLISNAWYKEGGVWLKYQKIIEKNFPDHEKKSAYSIIWKVVSEL